MNKCLLLLILLTAFVSSAQTTVHRKIAQRNDDYIGSNWAGKDSFRWDYNSSASLIQQTALKTDVSSTWNPFFRYTYVLDANERVLTQVRENWVGGTWTNNTRYSYVYDTAGNVLQILYEVWNAGAWQETGMYEYSGYNSMNKYALETTRIKSGGVWVNYARRSIQYYANQYQAQYIEEFNWNASLGQWDNWRRYYYTYNLDSLSSKTTSVPYGSGWLAQSRILHNFSTSPFLKQNEYYQEWDTVANPAVWADKDRFLYTYTGFDSLERIQHEVMTSTGWFPAKRTNYLYNSTPRLSEQSIELYSGSWNFDTRNVYSYTGSKLTEMNEFYGLSGSWAPLRKTIYNYASFDSLIYKQVDTFNGAAFYPNKRSFYYYNAMTVGVNEISNENEGFVVYPNPARDLVHIRISSKYHTSAEFRLTDLLGRTRLIMQQDLQTGINDISIQLQGLPSGTYLLLYIEGKSKHSSNHIIQVVN